MPNNPDSENQATLQLSQAEQTALYISTLKSLPSFMYCPNCGTLHFGNDMHFSADVTGRAYGSAWLGNDDIETETNEDDNDYENLAYFCDHDDTEITDELRQTLRYISKIKRFATDLNINLSAYERVKNIVNDTSNTQFRFEGYDRANTFVRYIVRNDSGRDTVYELINPMLYNIARNMAVESEYEFNYNHPMYDQMIRNFNIVLASLDTTPDGPTAEAIGNNITTMPDGPFTYASRPQIDPGDRDPMNSSIHTLNNHQRWRDNDLSYICTCEHCSYSFECDNNIDLVTCPKCNKETQNAQENNNNQSN